LTSMAYFDLLMSPPGMYVLSELCQCIPSYHYVVVQLLQLYFIDRLGAHDCM
jgi:hypothetical protein